MILNIYKSIWYLLFYLPIQVRIILAITMIWIISKQLILLTYKIFRILFKYLFLFFLLVNTSISNLINKLLNKDMVFLDNVLNNFISTLELSPKTLDKNLKIYIYIKRILNSVYILFVLIIIVNFSNTFNDTHLYSYTNNIIQTFASFEESITKDIDRPPIPVSKISISKNKITIKKGKSITLKAIVNQDATNQEINWSSANSKIATVENGIVKGKKKGTVEIIAIPKDNDKIQAICQITVK